MLYLEYELVDAINEPLSPLVNNLLRRHLEITSLDFMNEEQLKKELEIAKMEEEVNKRAKEIRHGSN